MGFKPTWPGYSWGNPWGGEARNGRLQGKEGEEEKLFNSWFKKVRMRTETASPGLARLWRWLPFFTFPHDACGFIMTLHAAWLRGCEQNT